MDRYGGFAGLVTFGVFWLLGFASIMVPRAQGWSKEGHILTCRIAQVNFDSISLDSGKLLGVVSIAFVLVDQHILILFLACKVIEDEQVKSIYHVEFIYFKIFKIYVLQICPRIKISLIFLKSPPKFWNFVGPKISFECNVILDYQICEIRKKCRTLKYITIGNRCILIFNLIAF